MSWMQILLWVNGAAFIGYGLVCVVSPGLAAGYAGFELGTVSGTVEVIAMYGGLQTGFGVLMILGASKPGMRDTALWALAVVVGSLATARLIGLVVHGTSPYNLGALGFEVTVSILAAIALRNGAQAPAETAS